MYSIGDGAPAAHKRMRDQEVDESQPQKKLKTKISEFQDLPDDLWRDIFRFALSINEHGWLDGKILKDVTLTCEKWHINSNLLRLDLVNQGMPVQCVWGRKGDSMESFKLLNNIISCFSEHHIKLQRLNLQYMFGLAPASSFLSSLTDLKKLDLEGCGIPLVVLRPLPRQLNELCYSGALIEIKLEPITELTNLTSLDLSFSSISDQGLNGISNLTALQKLDLRKSIVSDLTEVAELKNLTDLCLADCQRITNHEIGKLTKLTNLKTLNIWKTRVLAEGIAKLSNLTNLNLQTPIK